MSDEQVTPEIEEIMTETGPEQDAGAERIAALETELAEAKAASLYAAAEAQNTRRRLEASAAASRDETMRSFARDILSVSDNLDRALAAIPAELRDDERFKPVITGIEATGRELASIFQRHGITRVESMGQMLDPNKHQAMLQLDSDQPAGTIVQEMAPGYMIKDKLLRPAMVGVAKG